MAGLSLRLRPCSNRGMQRSVRIETLGDLAAHGYGLNAMCEKCGHRVDLDILALIERFGPDFVYVGRHLDAMLTCTACGARAATVQVHNCLSNRSRHADGP